MKNLKHIILFTLTVTIFNSCSTQKRVNQLANLVGVWKIENKQTFEVWERTDNNNLIGKSYKTINGKEKVGETLSIKTVDNKVIYEATVPNQNNGNAIPFKLNNSNNELLSFENLSHDFPKKIQYNFIDDNKILVNVLGVNNEGFSYYLLRQ